VSRLFPLENVTDSDDWYTPAWVFDGLGMTFDLDVCSPDHETHVPAARRYTVADDGLLSPWDGWVWCNPPYSAPTAWCRKWAEQKPGGCLLVRADLSTGGPFVAFSAADAVFVPSKRLQFESGEGRKSGAVNFSTVLLGRGRRAVDAMRRLAVTYGGSTRKLESAA
jgi:phage N-6-adenine-methyltransferase